MESSTIALIIIGAMLILYITEVFPIATTTFLAVLALAIFGVIPMGTAFEGFGSDTTFLIVGTVVLGSSLYETGVTDVFAKYIMKIMSRVGTNERVFILVLIPITVGISLFLSNTATSAIMLPIVGSIVAVSGGKLTKKNTFMMIGIIAVAGGGVTIVGSTPQLIALQYLVDGGYEPIRFWELAWTGVPILLLAVIFFQTIGLKLQNKVFNFPDVVDPPKANGATKDDPKNVKKMWINTAILVFCIAGFLTERYDWAFWSLGGISMVGAILCIVTGCIKQHRVFERMDWTTVVIMGCSVAISAAIRDSGAGRLIADTVINILGDSMTPWLLCAVLALLAMVLTNFMSSTATTALLVPIAASLARELGFDVKSFVMVIAIAGNIGYATPVSTPPITMTLVGGYRFKDYVKVGGLFNLMAYILLILLFPLVLNF